MVRTTKTPSSKPETSKSDAVAPATKVTPAQVNAPVTPVAETATAAAPKKAKKTPKTPETSVTEPVVVAAAPAVASAAAADNAAAPVINTNETDLSDTSMIVKLNIFGAKLQQLTGLLSSVKSDFKLLEKLVAREIKNAQKFSRKKKTNANRQPSGFVKPTRISDELAQFLGKNIGCEMARTDVSKEINAYIRSNGLQDKANGRKINADPKLSNLLKLNKEDELTYFNLQRYMKHHFIKSESAVASA